MGVSLHFPPAFLIPHLEGSDQLIIIRDLRKEKHEINEKSDGWMI